MVEVTHENLLMRASAGTGKTYQLSTRYLQLLCQGNSVEQILATTFTRKAAGEILQRIVQRLTEAARHPRRCDQLGQALGLSTWTCADATRQLRELTRNLHRVRVSTFDSFFAQLARAFSLELGLSPGWRIVAEHELHRMRQRAIHNLLAHHEVDHTLEIMHLLTPGDMGRRVAEDIHSVVEDLYGTFLETGAEAWQAELTATTQQKPYTQETLQAAYDGLLALANSLEGGLCKYLAEFCEKVRDLVSAPHQFEEWKKLPQTGVLKKILDGEEKYRNMRIPPEVARAYRPFIDHIRRLARLTLAHRVAATGRLLSAYHIEYRKEQELQQALSFSDVIYHLAQAGWSDPRQWAFRLDTNLEHLLLDEFQDTSAAQWSILRPLVRHLVSQPQRRSLFCVGDVKQAIYGWRGGDSRIFKAFQRDVTAIREQELSASFRSCPTVIEAVNQVFSRIHQHPDLKDLSAGVKSFVANFPRHSTHREDLEGEVTLTVGPGLKSLSTDEPLDAEDEAAESDAADRPYSQHVAATVKKWHEERPTASLAVLVRSNRFAAEIVYELKKIGLNVSDEGRSSLHDSAAVQLILSALRLADHPDDTSAAFHLAASPWSRSLGITHSMSLSAIGLLAARWRRQLVEHGYGHTVAEWVDQLIPLGTQRDQRRLERFREIAFAYDAEATLRTHDFLNRVLNDQLADPTSAAIRVMTLHASKGLQFDIVVLPELHTRRGRAGTRFVIDAPEPGLPAERILDLSSAEVRAVMPPELQRIYDEYYLRQAEEMLSTVYVAMTRAVHALHMIIPGDPKVTQLDEPPKHKNTPSGLIHFGLAPTLSPLAGATLYVAGNPAWQLSVRPASGTSQGLLPLPQLQIAPPPTARTRGLANDSPSSREGGPQRRVRELLAPTPPQVFQLGTLLHSWLERIRWLSDPLPSRAELLQRAQPFQIPSAELKTLVNQFLTSLQTPPLCDLLELSHYRREAPRRFPDAVAAEMLSGDTVLEVRNELAIAYRDRERLVSGNMDRLVIWKHAERIVGAEVIDYKTDWLADSEAKAAKEAFYAPQLAAYQQAVQAMLRLPTDRVQTRLVFLQRTN